MRRWQFKTRIKLLSKVRGGKFDSYRQHHCWDILSGPNEFLSKKKNRSFLFASKNSKNVWQVLQIDTFNLAVVCSPHTFRGESYVVYLLEMFIFNNWSKSSFSTVFKSSVNNNIKEVKFYYNLTKKLFLFDKNPKN